MTVPPTGDAPSRLAGALLAWFDSRERDVPWRDERNPYRILVAEIMAQQTRMETVGPYYRRFVARFPDPAALAEADLDDVLKAWEGLGYYARARNLHAAARAIVRQHGGRVPARAKALRELPGVGPYTAGAVASIAFGASEPAIDGNARRVLSRLYDLESPGPADYEARGRALLAQAADRPGALNQAVMDLGSRICKPRRPTCPECPLRSACLARARGTIEVRPARRRRDPPPVRDRAAVVVRRDDRVLVVRRPEDGLLGGLWDFPSVAAANGVGGPDDADASGRPNEADGSAARVDATKSWTAELERELGISIRVGHRTRTVRHAFSHFRLRLAVHEAEWAGGELRSAVPGRWATTRELVRLAFPGYCRPVLADLGAEGAAEG